MKDHKEVGTKTTLILYFNSYNELRSLLVDTSTSEEAEDIALARGIKPVAIKNAGALISEYERRKRK